MKIYLTLVFLLSFSLNFSAKSFTSALSQNNYQVYNPNWSIDDNGGSLPAETLAPYKFVQNKNNKTPIVLIHGTASELRPFCNWKNLLKEFEKSENKEFLNEHVIYIFRYSSNTRSWENTSGALKQGLFELLSDYPPETKFKVVVSSLGGNLFCSAIQKDSMLEQKFSKGVSLGVPFWGTPLLNRDLMVEKSYSNNNKMINWTVSQIAQAFFPEINSHLPWTLPLEKTIKSISNSCSPNLQSRLINYAAFLDSPLTQNSKVSEKQMNEWLIRQLSQANYKHAWDAAMHYKMGWEIEQNFKPIYLFRFNDGLVPIFSSLWLDPKIGKFEEQTVLTEQVIKNIKKTNPNARLFSGIDHSDLTSGENPLTISKDLLHSSQKTTTAFVIQDLK